MIRTSPFRNAGPALLSFYVVAVFLCICSLFGGSARADEPLLLVVRLSAILALLALIFFPPQGATPRFAAPALLLAALAMTIAVQLLPLPPGLWQALPGHSRFLEAAALSGLPQPWRPISIDPDLTANSLMALLPAIVLCLGYTRIKPDHTDPLLQILCALGVVNVLVGALQLVGGPQSIAYYYTRTSPGIISGMFANRNHFSVYLALMVPILLYLGTRHRDRRNDLPPLLAGATLIMFLIIVLASGSRSGTAIFVLMTAAGAFAVRGNLKNLGRRFKWMAILLAIATGAALVLAYSWDRAIAIERLQMLSTDEMRIRSLPVILQIIRDFFPFGTGFGTFDTVFRMYEPDAMLKPTYFNNAHDDWLEILLTGGLPALLVTLAFLVWFARAAYRVFRNPVRRSSAAQRGQIAAILIAGTGIASLSDYPLRTPLFTALFALACCVLADAAARRNDAEPSRVA